MVFQNYALWPHMTVGANITYGLQAAQAAGRRDRRPRSSAACGKVNLAGLAERYPGPAVRRPAAAGGAGPRAGAEPRHPAARRAAVQPRREDPGAGARGDPQAAAGAAASRPSTSPTTRRRRCRSPTAWRSCATGACSAGGPAARSSTSGRSNRFVADFVGTNNLIPGVCTRAGRGGVIVETRRWARSRPGRRTRSAPASAACWRCGRRTWCSAAGARTPSAGASRSPRTSATPCATTSRRSPGSSQGRCARPVAPRAAAGGAAAARSAFRPRRSLTLPDE